MVSLYDAVYNDLIMTGSETEMADAIADNGIEIGEFLSCHGGGNTSLTFLVRQSWSADARNFVLQGSVLITV